jgi:hypothetical protein
MAGDVQFCSPAMNCFRELGSTWDQYDQTRLELEPTASHFLPRIARCILAVPLISLNAPPVE